MNKTQLTLADLDKVCKKTNYTYILTRYWNSLGKDPDDLDIYVKKQYFSVYVKKLTELGYVSSSHDQALGGRVPGAQLNLIRKDRIKIDLHNDFTWRVDRYLDLKLIESQEQKRAVDAFLVLINIVFEKTYITDEEYELFYKNKDLIYDNDVFQSQSKKYKWDFTYYLFKRWVNNKKLYKKNIPIFIPIYIVIVSYIEALTRKKKFHVISFAYYFYFMTRYFITKQLPYD